MWLIRGWSEINHAVFCRLSRANSLLLAELSVGPCADAFRFERMNLFTKKATQPRTNKTSWICVYLEGVSIADMFVFVCYVLTCVRSKIGWYDWTQDFTLDIGNARTPKSCIHGFGISPFETHTHTRMCVYLYIYSVYIYMYVVYIYIYMYVVYIYINIYIYI